jgi:hypothetical protein
MSNSVKEKISTDLKQVQEVGKARSHRIREIVQTAVFQIFSEVKSGSGDIRAIVQDVVEGISIARQQRIAETEAEIKRLQAQIDEQEDELEQEVETGIAAVKDAGQSLSSDVQEQIDRAIATVRDSEEAALLRKRYAQLQAQAAILRANLAARSEEYYDRAQGHLEDAQRWYRQARPKAEAMKEQADQKAVEMDNKIGEAGTALARRERQVRQLLRDLLHQAGELLKERQEHQNRDRALEGDVDRGLPELPPTKTEIEDSKIRQ